MVSPVSIAKRNKSELAWLGIALAAHGLLLLLPVGFRTELPQVPPRLTLELVQWRHAPAPSAGELLPSADEPVPESPTDRPADPAPGFEKSAADDAPPIEAAPAEPGTTDPREAAPEVHHTTATLLHSMSRMKTLPSEPTPSRSLGVHQQRELPANWGRRAGNEELLAVYPEMAVPMAPSEPVIVDRWLDASGDHNVVVTLPNGDTVCGRGQAWNPMQPLVEHVMMFRSCGSGGKRTFEMASRPTPLWSTAE